ALLPAICAGEKVLALAFQEQGRFAPWRVATRAERGRAGFRIDGEKRFVLDGAGADHWLVLARTAGQPGERGGLTLFLLDVGAPGIDCTRTFLVDARNAAQLRLQGVVVGPERVV